MSPEIIDLLSSVQHWGVGSLLVLAVLFFLGQFMIPGIRAGLRLRQASRTIRALKAKGPVLDLDKARADAMVNDSLRHCWDEYRDTLHGQKQANAMGSLEVNRWRATAMSNGFFTEQALVERQLYGSPT